MFTVLLCGSKIRIIDPSKAELNPICHLLALLGTHHILHINRIRVKAKTKQEFQKSK